VVESAAQEEKKNSGMKKRRGNGGNGKSHKHTFLESPYYDPEELRRALPDWPEETLMYYYERMETYCKENIDDPTRKRTDWSATARSWKLRDDRDRKGRNDRVRNSA
jgi:hypothetical protein